MPSRSTGVAARSAGGLLGPEMGLSVQGWEEHKPKVEANDWVFSALGLSYKHVQAFKRVG